MSSPSVARACPKCKQFHHVTIAAQTRELCCPGCGEKWGEVAEPKDIFDRCPACGCRQFYLSKNFNQALGCAVMLVAIAFVPLTYGLSMPIGALIDWLLYKRVPTITNCYRCGMEFHGWDNAKRFKTFMHHIGLKYDKYR